MISKLLDLLAMATAKRHQARMASLQAQVKNLQEQVTIERGDRIFAQNALAGLRADYFQLQSNYSRLQFARLEDWKLCRVPHQPINVEDMPAYLEN